MFTYLQETTNFFRTVLSEPLDFHDKMEFVNLWYIMIIVNDLMIIVGSALKMRIELKLSHNYEGCGVLLGTGNLLVWFGVLRYLRFFETYNVSEIFITIYFKYFIRFVRYENLVYYNVQISEYLMFGC